MCLARLGFEAGERLPPDEAAAAGGVDRLVDQLGIDVGLDRILDRPGGRDGRDALDQGSVRICEVAMVERIGRGDLAVDPVPARDRDVDLGRVDVAEVV